MSTDATAGMEPPDHHQSQPQLDQGPTHDEMADGPSTTAIDTNDITMKNDKDHDNSSNPHKPTGLHSPPDSNNAMKLDTSDDSDLSDLEDPAPDLSPPQPQENPPAAEPQEEDEDIGDVFPDHWSGTVPVFKPDMHQFKDFKKFMAKVNDYGMKSGIIKIIPPADWKEKLPDLEELVKQVTVRQPIKQEIMGSNGTYRQVNILHQRSYNLPQWRQLCDQSEHQPPARRGERRAHQEKPKAAPRTRAAASATTRSSSTSRGRGRGGRGRGKRGSAKDSMVDSEERPMTPVSPKPIESVEQELSTPDEDKNDTPKVGRMGGVRQAKEKTQSISARRKYARREASARIDEEAFKEFDYRMDISDYTPERCEELERIYWKTLTYAPPLYGADLPGTLFAEDNETWNLNKLPNLLDVLGTKVPGVNTAYLYLGMWKSTFAWHLEDVDLYSINYLHFGAPKQWYSISQGDARRFEAAMKSIWPTDAKACDQFLRHKAFLISPNHLQQYFNIKVNKCVSYPGEFVVTYPYGYHSGYNLGYNCAEAVNFALDSWLPMGKIAKRCECAQAQDSVWVDVYEIERKLRGEETDYEETEEEEDEDDDEDDDDDDSNVATPQATNAVSFRQAGRKRKRTAADKGERKPGRKIKKIRLRVKNYVEPPCCLCPHDISGTEVLPTDDGRKAHRICALYSPETWIETIDDKEIVANAAEISKARLDLKCLYCRSKRGACFQCSHKKCARSYHATCAAAAGVMVEEGEVPIFGEDGTEYKEQAFEFSCRFHRTKRDRKRDGNVLDDCQRTRQAAAALKKGDICQMQYYKGDIFAGFIVENRDDEETLLVDVIPNGYETHNAIRFGPTFMLTSFRDRVEVEWKWLLLPDPADYHLPKASANAIPMPTSRKAKEKINATKRQTEELPRADSPFVDGFTWAEFNAHSCTNREQAKVDFSKENQVWYYLGRNSTEARAQYTEDPKRRRHNPRSNYLDSIPRLPPPPPQPRKSHGFTFAAHINMPTTSRLTKTEKPYEYKPKNPITPSFVPSPYTAQQFIPRPSPYTAQQFVPKSSPYPPQQSVPVPQRSLFTPQQFVPKQNYATTTFAHKALPAKSTPPPNQPQPPRAQPSQAQLQAQQPSPIQQSSQTQQHPLLHHSMNLQQLSQAQQPSRGQPSTNQRPQASHQTQVQPTKPTQAKPSQGGHTRNSQSLNLHKGATRPFGEDSRFRTSSFSYGSSRFETNTKSPFSHGFTQPPGLGPSPSRQNGQLFQAQARARSSSSASTRSFTTPMTSSVIRPSSSASSQGTAGQSHTTQTQVVQSQPANLGSANKPPRQSVVQKYAFFQVHHNRDSTKYRTPYAPWGGFTNGYEGNLRAHLMRTPDALFGIKGPSIGSSNIPGVAPSVLRHSFNNDSMASVTATPTPVLSNGPHHNFNTPTSASNRPTPSINAQGPATPQPLPTSTSSSHRGFSSSILPGAPSTPHIKSEHHHSPASLKSWDLGQAYASNLHPALQVHIRLELIRRQHMLDTEMMACQEQVKDPTPPANPESQSAATPPSMTDRVPTTAAAKQLATEPRGPGSDRKENPKEARTSQAAKAPKQTYIPPPRPWEALRKTPQTGTTPSPTITGMRATPPVAAPTTPGNYTPLPADTPDLFPCLSDAPASFHPSNPGSPTVSTAQEQAANPLMSYGTGLPRQLPNQGVQPRNVSGPFWQKYPQTVPNSDNSLRPHQLKQPPYNPYQTSPQNPPPSNQ